jgi:hypothetical protein
MMGVDTISTNLMNSHSLNFVNIFVAVKVGHIEIGLEHTPFVVLVSIIFLI